GLQAREPARQYPFPAAVLPSAVVSQPRETAVPAARAPGFAAATARAAGATHRERPGSAAARPPHTAGGHCRVAAQTRYRAAWLWQESSMDPAPHLKTPLRSLAAQLYATAPHSARESPSPHAGPAAPAHR